MRMSRERSLVARTQTQITEAPFSPFLLNICSPCRFKQEDLLSGRGEHQKERRMVMGENAWG